MSQVVFAARKRADKGSAVSGRLRRSGRIPAVMYGRSGQAFAIDLDAQEFTNGIKSISESTIVKLEIDGAAHEAFVKDTQRNIINGKILHIDFYEVESGKVLHAKVPLHMVGTPAGTREGGILEAPLHEIEVECLPKDLPEGIDVDVSALKANQSIHVRDLKLGAGIRILSNRDQVIALVKFAKGDGASSEVAETEAPKA